jgi:thiamine biosynthesis lipoprotein ApbE
MNASTLAHVIQQVISSNDENDQLRAEVARLRDEVDRLNSLLHPRSEPDRLNSLLHPRSEPECQEMTEDEAHDQRDW